MLPGPVFFHELRAAARRRRTFAIRTAIGLVLLYILITFIPFGRYRILASSGDFTPGELAELGGAVFAAVATVEFLLICAMAPAFVAGAIAEDRQRKVLTYLLASPLGGVEIVLGKFAARLINLVSLLLMSLPIISIASFLGGVDPAMVWMIAGAGFSMLFLFSSAAMCVSLYCQRPREAILGTYAVVAALIWGPPILIGLLRREAPTAAWLNAIEPLPDWIYSLSPMAALFQSRAGWQGIPTETMVRTMLSQSALAIGLLAWATLRLRPMERGPRVGRMRRFLGLGARREGPFRLLPRPRLGERPMLWKECTGSSSSASRTSLALAVLLRLAVAAGLAWILLGTVLSAIEEARANGTAPSGYRSGLTSLNMSIRTIVASLYSLAALLVGVSAATGFTSERERDTWISLVATPLEGTEIVLAKICGAVWRVRWLLAAILATLITGLLAGAVHPLGFVLCIGLTAFYLAFPAILGTYLSLRCKTSAWAIGATVGIGLFLNLGYLFCCSPFLMAGAEEVLAAVTPLFVAAAPFSRNDPVLSNGIANHSGRFVSTLFLSIGLYGIAGVMLYNLCVSQFEKLADRPKRPFLHPLEQPNTAGIRFLDKPSPSNEVVFEDDDEDEIPAPPKSDGVDPLAEQIP